MNAFISLMGSTVSSSTGTAGAAGGAGSMASTIIMFVLIIGVFYFMIIRPQKKRDKEAKDMLAALKKGDKIVTIGGIRGTVAAVKDLTVIVKVDDNARIEFSKSAISQVLNATQIANEKAAGKNKKSSAKGGKEEETVAAPAAGTAAAAEAPVAEAAPVIEEVPAPESDSEKK